MGTDLSNTFFRMNLKFFQQDSPPCHKSKKVTKYIKEMKIKVLDWSGFSSDFKPIGICGQPSSSAFVVKTVQQKQSS